MVCAIRRGRPTSTGSEGAAAAIGKDTPLPSLQVGLSTMDSFTDGRHPANSRSISWASPTQPLYKIVNPQAVFDRLVGGEDAGR